MIKFFLFVLLYMRSFFSQSILPLNLVNFDGGFLLDEVLNARFNWRWKTRGQGEKFRVLTIEGNFDNSYFSNKQITLLYPMDLSSKDKDFYNELRNTQFNWRRFKMDNGNEFNAVTIENLYCFEGERLSFLFGAYQTYRMVWAEPLDGSYTFNWRWFDRVERNDGKYRLVTLE